MLRNSDIEGSCTTQSSKSLFKYCVFLCDIYQKNPCAYIPYNKLKSTIFFLPKVIIKLPGTKSFFLDLHILLTAG